MRPQVLCKAGFASACLITRITGEPYSGNLYVRFDEDSGNKLPELLYWLKNMQETAGTEKERLNHRGHRGHRGKN